MAARHILTSIFVLLLWTSTSTSRGSPNGDINSIGIVECVNSVNGYATPLDDTPWELDQVGNRPLYDTRRFRLADNYQVIYGRTLGWHGTWSVYIDASSSEWIAYDSRPKNDRLAAFGSSFVPQSVSQALATCGVKWGGHWSMDPPFIDLSTGKPYFVPKRDLGADLLPPPRSVEINE